MHVRQFRLASISLVEIVSRWANVTAGEPCVVENTAYIAYGSDGEFIDIVSRYVPSHATIYAITHFFSGNCRVGLYCDSQSNKCVQNKALGEACSADKE